jgi:hypothetical protein
VLRFSPDVVFLQESPNEQAVQELGLSLFGSAAGFVWTPDCTIIARGQLQPGNAAARNFVQATLKLVNGQTVELICFRLSPPLVRYDLWSPGCWLEHATIRRKHRQEATNILNALSPVPLQRPVLIGGDCNSPAGDGALRAWNPRLHDSFGIAGRGWGATVLNVFPVLRFDQLWCNDEVEPTKVWSMQSQHSDHRLVVGNFKMPSTGS